jgi:hypothetical protein
MSSTRCSRSSSDRFLGVFAAYNRAFIVVAGRCGSSLSGSLSVRPATPDASAACCRYSESDRRCVRWSSSRGVPCIDWTSRHSASTPACSVSHSTRPARQLTLGASFAEVPCLIPTQPLSGVGAVSPYAARGTQRAIRPGRPHSLARRSRMLVTAPRRHRFERPATVFREPTSARHCSKPSTWLAQLQDPNRRWAKQLPARPIWKKSTSPRAGVTNEHAQCVPVPPGRPRTARPARHRDSVDCPNRPAPIVGVRVPVA